MTEATGLALDRRCLSGMRVLVVDDDEDVREALLAILSFYGADACVAECAGEARALLAWQPFDVLLSDVDMPDENGYALIRTVRRGRRTAELRAAAVTGRASMEDRAAAMAAGFDLVVAKPLAARVLVDAVRVLAGRA